jgi:hypothetical protein
MRISIFNNLRTDRDYTSSTGLTKSQFEELAQDFCELYSVAQNQFPENFGNDPAFPDGRELLFLLLYYKKTGTTFDLLALSFGVVRSTAHNYVEMAKTILKLVLSKKKLLPKRFFTTEAEAEEFFKDIPDLMIDAVERQMQRPDNQEEQKKAYSVKKKFCAFKNTIITSYNKFIYYLSDTVLAGKIHDFKLFKTDLCIFKSIFKNNRLWIDLGYLGIKDVVSACEIHIPHKVPRKSKENPVPKLTIEQKEYNTFVGKNRVVVENSIAGMKRYNILVNKFRNKTIKSADDMIELSAGLWNFRVAKRLNMIL